MTTNTQKQTTWSVDGAVNVLLDAPMPGSDTVFAPDFTNVNSARKFLEENHTEKEIEQLMAWGTDKRLGRPLREF